MYLFGSRSPKCPKQPTASSDIDIFVENDSELAGIPKDLLIACGGPIDAFWMPNADGWAYAIGDENRCLLCWDKWGLRVEPIKITIEEVIEDALRIS